MTVYTYTVNTTNPDFNNQSQTIGKGEIVNPGTDAFSTDATSGGAEVVTKDGRYKTITHVNDLLPSDRVTIQGIEMTVEAARNAGYSSFLEGLADKSARAFQKHSIEGQPLPQPEAPTPEEQAAIQLETQVGQGLTSYEEVNAGETIAAAFELHAGLKAEETSELVEDLLKGEIPQDDSIWQDLSRRGVSQEATRATVDRAVSIGQGVAERELGTSRYMELTKMADTSTAIRNLVIKHGINRASGKANASWLDVYNLAKEYQAR